MPDHNIPSKDVTDGIEWLRAAAGATRGNIVPFPQPLAVALLLRFEALEVELRKYDPSFPGETLTTPPQSPETTAVPSVAARDVMAERVRQVNVEGWSLEHDDEHEQEDACPLLAAAISYADNAWRWEYTAVMPTPPVTWPWDSAWWKPKDKRRDLVRSAALLIAEIERLDRRAVKTTPVHIEKQEPLT